MEAVVKRVKEGRLAFIGLHSAHWAKPFVRLMQERAKADAIEALPETERTAAQWEYLNTTPYYQSVGRAARITPFVEKGEGSVWKLMLPACVFPAYRNDGAPSHMTTLLPQHPIAKGLPAQWDKGEHFRSGCVWKVGKGRVFYFRPGHETYPVFKQGEALRVMENAVRWMAAK